MGNRRKLEITLTYVPSDIRFHEEVPCGWDDMTPEEQKTAIDNAIDHIKSNYVWGEGRIVEVSE